MLSFEDKEESAVLIPPVNTFNGFGSLCNQALYFSEHSRTMELSV